MKGGLVKMLLIDPFKYISPIIAVLLLQYHYYYYYYFIILFN